MLADFAAVATAGVKDLDRARPFYEEALGLKCVDANSEVLTFEAGGHSLFVYRTDHAGTNKATTMTWTVKSVDEVARELRRKGVSFIQYGEMPGLTRDGDLYRGENNMTVAWFKDPDDNIHSLVSSD